MNDLSYPIGTFSLTEVTVAPDQRAGLITAIAELPAQLRSAVQGLSEAQFDTPYRPGGWTVRQVVHHVPDSHLNAYVRFKLALTEENPAIKPYEEARWAELPDTAGTQIGVSLVLLEALHRRWVVLLRSMTDEQWSRTYFHPDHQTSLRLDAILAMYAWHGKHHTAHITRLRERMGWA
ncbi:MAG TPA: bacillithiol transferase BstA [Gemmatimonadales bacterium]|nr:bacillithiol transferase BstA [Gemmatimonadales bacterium]